MILKRKKLDETGKKKEVLTLDELKDKENLYKDGIAGGVTGAVVGGLTAGAGYLVSQLGGNPKNAHLKMPSPDALRKMKALGLGTAGLGAGLAVASGIKRRKVVKKIKEEEAKNNANTENKE